MQSSILSRRALIAAGLASLIPGASLAGGILAMPFTYTPSRKMLIDMMIGGKGPYPFLIDTGAYNSGMRNSLAQELGLKSVSQAGAIGLGGNDVTSVYRIQDIVIGGGLRLKEMRLQGLDHFPVREAQGMLAAWLLTKFPSLVDFEAMQIRLYIDTDVDLTGFAKLSGGRYKGREDAPDQLYVELKLDGRKVTCVVDTGATVGLYLSTGYVQRYQLWDSLKDATESSAVGASGVHLPTRKGHMNLLEFGSFQVPSPPVVLADPKGDDKMQGVDVEAILGMGLLAAFNLALPKDGNVYVCPNHNAVLADSAPDAPPAP